MDILRKEYCTRRGRQKYESPLPISKKKQYINKQKNIIKKQFFGRNMISKRNILMHIKCINIKD
jgi:hypothetical protein